MNEKERASLLLMALNYYPLNSSKKRQQLRVHNRRIMLVEIDINKHNFSKIGKYISNKLHHIHKPISGKHPSLLSETKTERASLQRTMPQETPPKTKRKSELRQRPLDFSPPVGNYRVNYAAVDKNIHQYNFTRSTPHFYNQKYKAQQTTPHLKEYPDGLSPKHKGFTELKRMVGREQIKGSIRKNLEDPHEARFEVYKFPTLAFDSKGIGFNKMSPRREMVDGHSMNGASYDCDFEVNMKRLNSHIIPFQKQTSRPETLFQQIQISDDSLNDPIDFKSQLTKSVEWSKQLSRQAEGILPSYMQKTVTSRMAISQTNMKTLEMNCSDMRERPKLQRKRLGTKQKVVVYAQTNRED